MAIQHCKVGMFPSGSGGGGFFTLYDDTAAAATVASSAYWADSQVTATAIPDNDERFRVLRLREALEDFVLAQASEGNSAANANRGGVAGFAIGNNTTGGPLAVRARRIRNADGSPGRLHFIG